MFPNAILLKRCKGFHKTVKIILIQVDFGSVTLCMGNIFIFYSNMNKISQSNFDYI